MKQFLIFLAVPLSFVLYLVLALNFGISQRYPVVHYLIALVALFFLGKALFTKFSIYRLVLNLLGWALLLFFGWWTLFYSSFEEMTLPTGENPQLAAGLNALTIDNAEGETVAMGDLLKGHQATLLIFYRGYW